MDSAACLALRRQGTRTGACAHGRLRATACARGTVRARPRAALPGPTPHRPPPPARSPARLVVDRPTAKDSFPAGAPGKDPVHLRSRPEYDPPCDRAGVRRKPPTRHDRDRGECHRLFRLPDCRPAFLKAFERLARVATKAGVEGKVRFRVRAPLLTKSKADIVRWGERLGVPWSLTWSCYAGGRTPCGTCDSCRLRARGFAEAAVADPLAQSHSGRGRRHGGRNRRYNRGAERAASGGERDLREAFRARPCGRGGSGRLRRLSVDPPLVG